MALHFQSNFNPFSTETDEAPIQAKSVELCKKKMHLKSNTENAEYVGTVKQNENKYGRSKYFFNEVVCL